MTGESVGPQKSERVLLLVVTFACLAVLGAMFGPGRSYIECFFEDDFFYYVEVAENFVSGRGLTFDGITPTNGFHPLWMFVMVSLVSVCGAGTVSFYAAVAGLSCILAVLSTRGAFRLARRFGLDGCWCSAAGATVFALGFLTGFRGMETSPVLALLPWSAARALRWNEARTERNLFLLALSFSAVILARLDGAIWVGLVLMLMTPALFDHTYRARSLRYQASTIGWLGLGLLPALSYLGYGQLVHGSLVPISGLAKSLKPDFGPLWSNLGWQFVRARPLVFPLGLIVFAMFRLRRSRDSWLLRSMLMFPCLQLVLVAALSDWKVAIWYFYSIAIGGLGALVVLSREPFFRNFPRSLSGRRVFVVAVFSIAASVPLGWAARRLQWGRLHTLDRAIALAEFETAHPGVYAMGDFAGLVSHKLRSPLKQMEGLVQDRAYLHRVAARGALIEELQRQGVDYFVTVHARDEGDCMRADAPDVAGASSPVMTGLFCRKPLLDLIHAHHQDAQSRYRTVVFAVRPRDTP